MEFDADVLGSGDGKARDRLLPFEVKFSIGEIVQEDQVVLFGEMDRFFKKFLGRGRGRGVGRIGDDQHFGLVGDVAVDHVQVGDITIAFHRRQFIRSRSRQDRSAVMGGVAGGGDQHRVAGVEIGENEMDDPLLAADQFHDLVLVNMDVILALAPLDDRSAENRVAFKREVTVVGLVFQGLNKDVQHFLGRQVGGGADGQVDQLFPFRSFVRLQLIEQREDVRRQFR